MDTPGLADARWRKSSHSGGNGDCVEAAALDDGTVAVRNSNRPETGAVLFTPAEIDAFLEGVKAGEFARHPTSGQILGEEPEIWRACVDLAARCSTPG